MQSRRKFLRFLAGTPGLALLPASASAQQTSQGPSDTNVIRNAEEAAALVLSLARQADREGTFGVGGAIVESDTGRVVHTMHNKVLQRLGAGLGKLSNTVYVSDPTAHGERQLVYWYYENRMRLSLPDPEGLTVITSLDPCAMCAGSLLKAGFRVAVVAYDDFAGVNWKRKGGFESFPPDIRSRFRNTFGYFAVENSRPWSGQGVPLVSRSAVTQASAENCDTVFSKNAEKVRDASNASGLDPRAPANRMIDPAKSPLRDRYRLSFEAAFSVKLEDYRRPDDTLKRYLRQLVQRTPGAKNAVAFIDYFGNLMMASADRFDISPVATAFMTTVQNYSKLRFALVNDPSTSEVAQRSLVSPKFGTFVFLHAPDGFDPNTLKDLGAYGSTMEGPIPIPLPSNFQFFEDPLVGSADDLRALIAGMPPLYIELVGINPQKVQ